MGAGTLQNPWMKVIACAQHLYAVVFKEQVAEKQSLELIVLSSSQRIFTYINSHLVTRIL